MSRQLVLFIVALFASTLCAHDEQKPNTLSPKQIEEGWIMLFDGETTYGWTIEGDVKVANGELAVGGPKKSSITTTSAFGQCEIRFEYALSGKAGLKFGGRSIELAAESKGAQHWSSGQITVESDGSIKSEFKSLPGDKPSPDSVGQAASSAPSKQVPRAAPTPVQFTVDPDSKLLLRSINLKPLGARPLFNGKDLEGWKVFPGERYKSKFTVTPEGWINIRNGPGDLQTTDEFADFLLQVECISNGKALNSGVFFRCIANQYQNGYEAQIQNGFKNNDRTKPADFGTGAIYRRIPARKVVPNDHEWFTMTVLAQGKHIATWVNGYQTVDWTDPRPADKNPRTGSKTEAGHLSLQGHDPTTDLNFRNIRIVEFRK